MHKISILGKDGKTITVDSHAKKMSIKDYHKARGVRSYDMSKDLEAQRRNKVKTPAEIRA